MHAMRSGLTRAASAPAVLAGVIAVVWWLRGTWETRTAIAGFLLWAFLAGGILDRYARGRPTRARGFFAACGAHASAMIRLGVLVLAANLAIHAGLSSRVDNVYVMALSVSLLLAIALVSLYAQVRLVVEDRRSAAGAVLASLRFVRRHPASIGIYLVYMAAITGASWALSQAAPPPGSAQAAAVVAASIAVPTYLALSLYASGIVLFQSRLAHAGYTAGPRLEWPDSPAAEAIRNASPAAP